jgi:hypothetical protein
MHFTHADEWLTGRREGRRVLACRDTGVLNQILGIGDVSHERPRHAERRGQMGWSSRNE